MSTTPMRGSIVAPMTDARHFTPHERLAARLLTEIGGDGDGAHDLSHILRVWANVRRISAAEGGDAEILTAATILHDCVNVAKDAPERAMASRLSARRAVEVLRGEGWAKDRAARAGRAIEAHSFSAGIPPRTLEAKVLQDADRLDSLGLDHVEQFLLKRHLHI